MKHQRSLPQLENFRMASTTGLIPSRNRNRPREAPATLTRRAAITSWICRFIAAGIMLETLFFKFTGAPESVYIFSKMGLESWWRYGQGIWELAASALLLTPRLGWAGGLLTLGAIGAAIVSHLTVLGIEIQGDGGLLFAMAIVTFLCGFIVTILHRREIPAYTPSTAY